MAISRWFWLGLWAVTALPVALLADPVGGPSAVARPAPQPIGEPSPVVIQARPAVRGDAPPVTINRDSIPPASAADGPTPPVYSPAASPASSPASSTQPAAGSNATQPDAGVKKDSPLDEGQFRGAGPAKDTGAATDIFSRLLGPVWWALAVVIGLAFLAAFVLKRIGPTAAAARGGGMFRLLARWHLPGRGGHYVALLQVGRRVLLVGVTGQQINLLSEVSDPAEIQHLLANSQAGRSILSEGFGQLLGRNRQAISEAVEESTLPASSASLALGQLGSTIDRAQARLASERKEGVV